MNKPLRIAAWSIGALISLLIAVVIALPLIIDPNDYRDEIASLVEGKTGRQLTIEGDLKLSVFPWLGVSIGKIRLANAAGFTPETFAAIDAAQVHVKLMPLLERRLVMDTLLLKGLNVHLAVDKSGKDNWSDMIAPTTGGARTGSAPKAVQSGQGPASSAQALAALAIGGVRVENAAVSWRDDLHGQAVRVDEVNLETGAIDLRSPIPVKLSFDLVNKAPDAHMHGDLSTNVTLMLNEQRFEFHDLKVKVNGEVKDPAVHGHMGLSGDITADLPPQRYKFAGLKLDAVVKGKSLPGGEISGSLVGLVEADLKAQIAQLTGVQLTAQGISAGLDGKAKGLLEAPAFDGHLKIASFDPRELMKQLAIALPERADPDSLSKLDAIMDLSGDMAHADVSNLVVHLDDSTLSGRLGVHDFSRPTIRYTLKLDHIDADRYLPPPAKADATPVVATPATAGAAAAQALPTDVLKALNVQGRAEIGRLKIMKLIAEGIVLDTRADGGVISLKPRVARFYKGRYDGNMRLDARTETPEISVDERLAGVDLEPLVKDFLEKDLIFGRGDVELTLKAKGIDPEQAVKTLNGKVRLAVANGGVKGVDLIKLIKSSGLQQVEGIAPDALDQTAFTRLSASGVIRNGVLDTRDLLLDSAQLDVTGQGKVDLVRQAQDLRLGAKPQKELAKLLGDIGKETIPVVVGGTFVKPTFKVDLGSLLKAKADAEIKRARERAKARLKAQAEREKAKAQARIEAEKKKLEDKAREDIKNKLKSLFR